MSEDALKLTTYFGERSRVRGRLLAEELLDIHVQHKIRSSILLRGIQGFGAKHRRRSDRLLTLSEDLPLVCIAVDTGERIRALMKDASQVGHEGLLTLERVQLHHANGTPPNAFSGQAQSPTAHHTTDTAQAVKLTVYLGRHERTGSLPAFAAACKTLHESGMAGATVLLGVDGTRHGDRERARFFARNANVPLTVTSVGDRQRIDAAVERLRQNLSEPLFTIEGVRVCKRDGILLAPPHDESTVGMHGTNVHQKLTIILSEAAVHEKRSVYLELVRRLRAANAAGATSLRGIWGFHGDHPPHGDRLLSFRRHVPVITETIDTPERIAALFPIVDELTRERGLVTSEPVPAASAPNAAPGL